MIAAMRLLLAAAPGGGDSGADRRQAQRAARRRTASPAASRSTRSGTLGCEHHVRYEELNGIAWTHQETPGKPGFTKDGQLAGAAAATSRTRRDGSTGTRSRTCRCTWRRSWLPPSGRSARTRAAGASAWTSPSAAAGSSRPTRSSRIRATDDTASSRARPCTGSGPRRPATSSGSRRAGRRGRRSTCSRSAPWQFAGPLHVTMAKLRGPHGPVTIRVVDAAQHPKIKPYVSPGAYFLIPVSPLARAHALHGDRHRRRRQRLADEDLELHDAPSRARRRRAPSCPARRRRRRAGSARPRGRRGPSRTHGGHELQRASASCVRRRASARPSAARAPCSGFASTSVTLSNDESVPPVGNCRSTTPTRWPAVAGLYTSWGVSGCASRRARAAGERRSDDVGHVDLVALAVRRLRRRRRRRSSR